jgi:glycosyltransferase involved in cell wall biosynthesis
MSRFRRQDASGLRSSLGLSAAHRVILSPKILQPLYRIHLVVEAMALVSQKVPDAVLLITEYLRDPDYRAAIVQRISELNLGAKVIFCGTVSHEDMPMFYSMAELAVAVPSSDGLPQTLLEGMACGTPNILSKLPRYEEIVRHEESALFVDPTPSDIGAGIVRLLQDHELQKRIASNAFKIVAREANLEEQAQHVARRYEELVQTVRPRVFVPSRLWAACRSFVRFRKAMKP